MDTFTKTKLDTKAIDELMDMYAPAQYRPGDWTIEMAMAKWTPLGHNQSMRRLDKMVADGIFTKISGILPNGKSGNLYRPVVNNIQKGKK